jgi:hypothetical protein
MLVIERAGDNICGLCVTDVMPSAREAGVAAEHPGLEKGEPRSEMVRQPTADGVAYVCQ